jgi:hypothetical protein
MLYLNSQKKVAMIAQNNSIFQRRPAVYDPSKKAHNSLICNISTPSRPPKNLAAEERLRAGTGRFSTRRFFHYNFISDSGIPDSGSENPKMISGTPKIFPGVPEIFQGVPKIISGVPKIFQGTPEMIRESPEIRFDLQDVTVRRPKAVFST